MNDDRIGVTHLLRKKLKFEDEKIWKKFSARRLELIDSLSLSEKKASEQDYEIRRCASTLMKEFGFPEENLMDFDKLVKCAIQSARRNRKRTLRREKSCEPRFIIMQPSHNPLSRKISETTNTTKSGPCFLSEITKLNSSSEDTSDLKHSKARDVMSADSSSKLAIDSLITPALKSSIPLPSVSRLSLSKNPVSEREAEGVSKLLLYIKRSKTCFQFTNSQSDSSVFSHENIEVLGKSCVTASLVITLERHFSDISPSAMTHLRIKLLGDFMLSRILKSLDHKSLEVLMLSEYTSAQLFQRLIGGCVKDFGFDPILNPLSEIFHSVILRDYPLISRASNAKPMTAAATENRYVRLHFMNKTLKFHYPAGSSSPPTHMELIENGKAAFNVVSGFKVLKIREIPSRRPLNSDDEVEKSFNREGVIDLELYHPDDEQPSLPKVSRDSHSLQFSPQQNGESHIVDQPVVFQPLL